MNTDVMAATTVKSYGYKLNADGHTFKSNFIQLEYEHLFQVRN